MSLVLQSRSLLRYTIRAMRWRYLAAGVVLGIAVTYAAAASSRSDYVTPHMQTGTLLVVNDSGFTFHPDGKSRKPTTSPDGTRSLGWDAQEWGDCDDQGNNCHWYEGVRPRCIHVGEHVKIAWVNVNYGSLSKESVLWTKCLDASTT
jgi:hypothetical protein